MKRLPFNHGTEDFLLSCGLNNLKHRDKVPSELLDLWEKTNDPEILREAAIYIYYYVDKMMNALPSLAVLHFLATPIYKSETVAIIERTIVETRERKPDLWQHVKRGLKNIEELCKL